MLYAFKQYNLTTYLVNRSYERAKSLSNQYNCIPINFHELCSKTPKLIINCASPSIYTSQYFKYIKIIIEKKPEIIWDTNYTRGKTPLLKLAYKLLIKTISGDLLFEYQAAEQQKLWRDIFECSSYWDEMFLGKTSIGKKLAKKNNYDLKTQDIEIERLLHKSIKDIFSNLENTISEKLKVRLS